MVFHNSECVFVRYDHQNWNRKAVFQNINSYLLSCSFSILLSLVDDKDLFEGSWGWEGRRLGFEGFGLDFLGVLTFFCGCLVCFFQRHTLEHDRKVCGLANVTWKPTANLNAYRCKRK